MTMQEQIGLEKINGIVNANIIEAILTTEAFTIVGYGNATIRSIQQSINKKYGEYLNRYIPTNGIFDRNTSNAFIIAIQVEVGSTVDGIWGNETMNKCPTLMVGSSNKNMIYLLQYLLYCYGFDPNGLDGGYGNGVANAVKKFQQFSMLDADGICGKQTWAALVVSCGDINRKANACDTRFEITQERAEVLKNNGYKVVGRYLTGGQFKELRGNELSTIIKSGLEAFVIYQKNNRNINDFSYSKGKQAAVEASAAAMKRMLPKDTVIYFAVDLDVYEDQIKEYIIPYFQGINEYISNKYRVGIYGPRLICSRVSEEELACSSFVADMSTGYSGNIGQKMPENWCYDQFTEISKFNNDFDIDKVMYNEKIPAISSAEIDLDNSKRNERYINFLAEAYKLAEKYHNTKGNILYNNLLVLQYIAYKEYPSKLWDFLVNYDEEGIKYIEENISSDERDLGIYVSEINQLISVPHLAVSLCPLLMPKTGLGKTDAIINDLTGWAGDLLQFAGNFEKGYKETTNYPNRDVSFLEQLIGGDDSLGFGLEDLIQDVDVWNLYKSLRNEKINIVFGTYYASDLTNRFKGFVNNRIEYGYLPDSVEPSDSERTKIFKLAYEYLNQDWSKLTGIVSTLFIVLKTEPITDNVIKTNAAEAFANNVTTMV